MFSHWAAVTCIPEMINHGVESQITGNTLRPQYGDMTAVGRTPEAWGTVVSPFLREKALVLESAVLLLQVW